MHNCIDPQPRATVLPYEEPIWPISRSYSLADVVPPGPTDFAQVLESRSSIRHLARAPLREITNLMMFATGARQVWGSSPRRSLRPSHSAGAIHAISILIVTGARRPRILKLDPLNARIELLRPQRTECLRGFVDKARSVVPAATADIVVLAADINATSAVYDGAASLIWRDAGALMQTIHLCAQALRIGFCPMGILGHDAVEAVLGPTNAVIAVGSAAVGRTSAAA